MDKSTILFPYTFTLTRPRVHIRRSPNTFVICLVISNPSFVECSVNERITRSDDLDDDVEQLRA